MKTSTVSHIIQSIIIDVYILTTYDDAFFGRVSNSTSMLFSAVITVVIDNIMFFPWHLPDTPISEEEDVAYED